MEEKIQPDILRETCLNFLIRECCKTNGVGPAVYEGAKNACKYARKIYFSTCVYGCLRLFITCILCCCHLRFVFYFHQSFKSNKQIGDFGVFLELDEGMKPCIIPT